jgi:hypothetical protein
VLREALGIEEGELKGAPCAGKGHRELAEAHEQPRRPRVDQPAKHLDTMAWAIYKKDKQATNRTTFFLNQGKEKKDKW